MTRKGFKPFENGKEATKWLEDEEEKNLAPYALKSKKAIREHRKKTPREYRTKYHRDRDRIIWCRTFKRLQHKTQIFPHYCTDHFRRRLTHSLEVSQIAATIARALKLNEVATEAMALAHDIGHAPFGHAGEDALNEKIKKITKEPKRKENNKFLLYGFDHAIQGIEVLERIEKEYEKDYCGLNLTFDVREGVLKHRRYDEKDKLNLAEITKFKAYKKFGSHPGSLEAQCVLTADKIAYFFADFEDALRSHILKCDELAEDSFNIFKEMIYKILKKKSYVENTEKFAIKNIDDFLEFRRNAIAGMILDIIKSSERRILEKPIEKLEDVKKRTKRIIGLSEDMEKLKDEVYEKYIEKRVFKNHLYQTTEHKAKMIVKDLFKAYLKNCDLIPKDYRDNTNKAYKKFSLDKDEKKILTVKNYIAGMTDSFAIAKHKDLFMSGEQITIS